METRLKNNIFTDLAYTTSLSLAYAIAGKLALMLALPPGYATAIFPPAGIAVAALLLWGNRIWPGVFFGSLLLNLWVGAEQGALTVSGLQVAVSAAMGASLQALAGAWLVRRFVGFPTALTKDQDILRFMFVAGPLACLLNASFGATALYATGIIPQSAYYFSWFTWWVGDSIGVLITAPLMLIAFAKPRELWWSRRTIVAIPLLLALSAVIVLFYLASKVEQARIESDFREITSETHEKMRFRFSSYLSSVAYIERFFSSSQHITREEFRSFVTLPLANYPGIQGLSWNPVIPRDRREQFEQSVRKEGFPDFQIAERDSNNKVVRAGERSEYVAVQYIEPMQGNESAFGFDVASNAERQRTLLKARDTGNTIATSRINLVQEHGEQADFLIFNPVYHGAPRTVEERRNALKGFAVGVFRVSDIVDSILNSKHYKVSIHDTGDGKSIHLYGPEDGSTALTMQYQLDIGGRPWIIRYWPTPSYLTENRSWQAWSVLAVGLSLVSLLGAFLLAMTGRAYHVENMVARRTAELRGILSTAIEAIITLDANGNIESVNPAGEALFGYTTNELTGASILTIIPDFFTGSGVDSTATKARMPTGARHDSYAVRKGGTQVPIELAISSVSLVDRTIFTAIVHDLTERQKVERMKDEFISTVSHELRTPLTSISGVLGLVAAGALDNAPEKIKPLLAIAYENCGRLNRLVDDLLALNKANFAEHTLKLQKISVYTLIEHAIEANQGFAAKYGVTLAWRPTEEDVYVNADEEKLIQVLSNLLSNAVKYSPKEDQVLVSTRNTPSEVRISVSDKGPGIPTEFQDRVFEKFAQADSSDTRRVGGTGLGMAIAKSLVEKHGGRISFVSQPGQGTTFHIDLSIAKRGNS